MQPNLPRNFSSFKRSAYHIEEDYDFDMDGEGAKPNIRPPLDQHSDIIE